MAENPKTNLLIILFITLICIAAALLFFFGGEVASNQIIVRQEYFRGRLTVFDQEGWYLRSGSVTELRAADQLRFSGEEKMNNSENYINVRFNDGSTAGINGTVRFLLPADQNKILRLVKEFGSYDRIRAQLIIPAIREALAQSAALLSSDESYTTKTGLFAEFAQDQAANGIYQTVQLSDTLVDTLTHETRITRHTEIKRDQTGKILRRNESLTEYGISLKNLIIEQIVYPQPILKQLSIYQQTLMDVKTAQSVARKELEVARLDREAAMHYSEAKTLRSTADANAARRLLEADGAFNRKLEVYENVMNYWAEAYKTQRPTPDIAVGGTYGNGGNAAEQMMSLIGLKALQDLKLDLNPEKVPRFKLQEPATEPERKEDAKKAEPLPTPKIPAPAKPVNPEPAKVEKL